MAEGLEVTYNARICASLSVLEVFGEATMTHPTDDSPDSSRASFSPRFRVALCQLHFHPATVYRFGSAMLQPMREPVYIHSSSEGLATHVLGAFSGTWEEEQTVDALRDTLRDVYLEFLRRRLTFILELCRSWRVELVVFPEFSIPGELLVGLMDAAKGMNVVFGSHQATRYLIKSGLYSKLGDPEVQQNDAVVPVLTRDGKWIVGARYLPQEKLTWPKAGPLVSLPDGLRLLVVPDQNPRYIDEDSLRKAAADAAIVLRLYTPPPMSGNADPTSLQSSAGGYVLRAMPSSDLNISHAGSNHSVNYPLALQGEQSALYLDRIGMVDLDRTACPGRTDPNVPSPIATERASTGPGSATEAEVAEKEMSRMEPPARHPSLNLPPVPNGPHSFIPVNTLHLIPAIFLPEYQEVVESYRLLSENARSPWLESKEGLLRDWIRRLAESPDRIHRLWRTRLNQLLDPHMPLRPEEALQGLTGFVPLPPDCPSAIEIDWGLGMATDALLTAQGLADGIELNRLAGLLNRYAIGRRLTLSAAPGVVKEVADEVSRRFSQVSPEPLKPSSPAESVDAPDTLNKQDPLTFEHCWLREVTLTHFKAAFEPPPIPLTPFTVLIGRNGSGKSTLLEALQWIDGTIREDARKASARYHGVHDLIHVLAPPPASFQIELRWEITLPDQQARPLYYRLEVQEDPEKQTPVIASESLHLSSPMERLIHTSPRDGVRVLHPDEAALKSLVAEPDRLALGRVFRQFWDGAVFLRLSPSLLAHGSSPYRSSYEPLLDEEGRTLPALLHELSTDQREELSAILRLILPDIEGVSVSKPTGNRDEMVHYALKEGMNVPGHAPRSHEVPAWMLSEGTRRITAILALLVRRPAPTLLCIEEIENGLDPWTVLRVLDQLRSAADRGIQIIITTHSPWLLDHVALESIIQVRRRGGETLYERFADRTEVKDYSDSVPPGTIFVQEIE